MENDFHREKVVAVRFTQKQFNELKRISQEMGLLPSTVAHLTVMKYLSEKKSLDYLPSEDLL